MTVGNWERAERGVDISRQIRVSFVQLLNGNNFHFKQAKFFTFVSS